MSDQFVLNDDYIKYLLYLIKMDRSKLIKKLRFDGVKIYENVIYSKKENSITLGLIDGDFSFMSNEYIILESICKKKICDLTVKERETIKKIITIRLVNKNLYENIDNITKIKTWFQLSRDNDGINELSVMCNFLRVNRC